MKTSLAAILLFSIAARLPAQTSATAAQPQAPPGQSSKTDYAIVARSANTRLWQRTNYSQAASGEWAAKVQKYTELATGVCYTNASGQLLDSSDAIVILPDGSAAATNRQTSVYFPSDIGSGVIRLLTPDGKTLQNGPAFLAFDDGTNTAIIATITNSVGQLLGSNQVLYPDIFHGAGFRADLLCKVRGGGAFESDLVFREQIPDPASLGLGADARVELLTEWFDTPEPVQTTNAPNQQDGLTDITLHFGSTTIGRGKAFVMGVTNAGPAASPGVPVYKRWVQSGSGQAFLVESVPYRRLAPQLRQLPMSAGTVAAAKRIPSNVSFARVLPSRTRIQRGKNGIQLARADAQQKRGLILDYVTFNGGNTNDFTFQSGETYLITGPFSVSGTTTIQDAVIKYATNVDAQITVDTVQCQTSEDHPAIFTSINDDSVGQQISGLSTGSPALDWTATALDVEHDGNTELDYLRISYAGTAIYCSGDETGTDTNTVRDVQIVHCGDGFFLNSDSSVNAYDQRIEVYNGLISDTGLAFDGYFWGGTAQHLTVDGGGMTMDWGYNDDGFFLTNCVLANVGEFDETVVYVGVDGAYNGFYNCGGGYWPPAFGSSPTNTGTSPFTSAAAAHYYLTTNCPFRNIGTTNINPDSLAEIQTMTTYAPQDGGFLDTNGTDLGYHYPTNEDSDNDGLPDWWEWKYFGTYAYGGSDLDGNNHTLLHDYQNSIDPPILFSVQATNSYANTNSVAVQLNLSQGVPFSEAVLVGVTNVDGATWNTYTSSNLTVNLGTTDGVYLVWIGLRGPQETSEQTWHAINFTLDRLAPTIAITNPVAGSTLPRPLIQVQGWVSESLASLVYDLTNADGSVTNQPAFITGVYPDTNTVTFTTNYFQAYDVLLADGTNTFTFYATDLAGNSSTTNFTVILDTSTDTNPPVLTVNWPETNTPIAGTNFVLSGTVDDPTATVTVSGDGFTNLLAIVERDGRFTIPGVPLTSATNALTVTVTNAHSLGSGISYVAIPAGPFVTVDPIQSSQISQDSMTLTGTVSATNRDVWINGVPAGVNEDGTWEADGIPVNSIAGSQQLNIGFYLSGTGPGTALPLEVQNLILPLPPVVQSSGYTYQKYRFSTGGCGVTPFWSVDRQTWQRGVGGLTGDVSIDDLGVFHQSGDFWGTADYLPASPWANVYWFFGDTRLNPPADACSVPWLSRYIDTESVKTSIELVAGGPAVAGQMQLIRLTASISDLTVPVSSIILGGRALTPTATNNQVGELYVAMPSGSKMEIPINVPHLATNYFNVHVEGYLPIVRANGYALEAATVAPSAQFCVGQLVSFGFSWDSTPPGILRQTNLWAFDGDFLNDGTNSFPGLTYPTCSTNYFINGNLLTNQTATSWWVSGGYPSPGALYTAKLFAGLTFSNGQTVQIPAKGQFNMFRPNATVTATTGSILVDTNYGGTNGAGVLEIKGFALHYGSSTTTRGITWSATIDKGSFADGTTEWAQVLNDVSAGRKLSDGSWWNPYMQSNIYEVLDGNDPVSTNNPVGDSPGILGHEFSDLGLTNNFNATVWLMFKPSGGQRVPLDKLTWYWSSGAVRSGTNWNLVNPTNNANPSFTPTEMYPLWTNNVGAFMKNEFPD